MAGLFDRMFGGGASRDNDDPGARPDEAKFAEARMGLARVLAGSPASGDEALRLSGEIQSDPLSAGFHHEAVALAGQIRAMLDEVYPRTRDGQPGAAPSGPCRVLAQTTARYSIPDVGRVLAGRLGMSALDTKMTLSRSPGLLAEGLAPALAESVAHAIQEIGVPVVIVAEKACPPAPRPETASSIRISESGTFLASVGAEEVEIDPWRLGHAQFARLRSSRFTQGPSRTIVLPQGGRGRSRRIDRTRTDVQSLCDLYLFEPLRRIRFVEGRIPIHEIVPSRPDQPNPTFPSFVKRLLKDAKDMPFNYSLDLLFSDGEMGPITYDSKQALDNRANWLFWLAFNGVITE